MAMDLIARATALSARSNAAQALARTATLDLFTNLPARSFDPAISTLTSTGHAVAGSGGGVYTADALATAALAAAHPRLCKQSLDGRYWRLTGDFITAEQGGAAGVPGTNDQPAIDAVVRYANAMGIQRVLFTKTAYELWCPTRTSSGGPGGGTDGYPIYITKAVALVGVPGGSVLTFKNSTGGDKSTITQTTAWGQWQGGGIWVNANGAGATADIPFIHIENLTLNGTTPYVAANGNGGSNLSDKGLSFPSNGSLGVLRLTLRNVTAYNFSGEVFYGGCFFANSTIVAENVELYNSNQSAWNPTGLGRVIAVNLNAHDAYLPSEIVLGQGHTYIGCRFANGNNAGCIGTQYYATGYHYTYPNRDLTRPPVWCTYINTTFEKIPNVTFSSWTRGKITTIDCSIALSGWNDRDIYMDVEHWFDQQGTSVTLSGPATLTTQYAGCPVGVYQEPPKNIRLNIMTKRTARAVANNVYADILNYTGLIDKDTVRVEVSGEARNVISPFVGSRPAGYAQPLTVVDPAITQMSGAQPFGGTSDTPAANVTYKVNWPAMNLMPTGSGPYSVTLDNTYGYANGQLVTFYYGQNSAQVMTFAASGAGMSLRETRKLAGKGDKLVLRWDARYSTWVEEAFVCAQPRKFEGSATYDAPSIAAGASATTTVTVTGCALGDYVTALALGISAGGLVLSGYVSAANTVTVVLANLTGAAIDLASTTLAVEVTRK